MISSHHQLYRQIAVKIPVPPSLSPKASLGVTMEYLTMFGIFCGTGYLGKKYISAKIYRVWLGKCPRISYVVFRSLPSSFLCNVCVKKSHCAKHFSQRITSAVLLQTHNLNKNKIRTLYKCNADNTKAQKQVHIQDRKVQTRK